MRNKSFADGMKAFLAVVMLFLYIIGNSQIESLHKFFFHAVQDELTHSAEQEKNPCHRSFYHQEKANACHHKAHFSVGNKCPFCDCVSFKGQVLPAYSSYYFYNSANNYIEHPILLKGFDFEINLLPRAPPLV